MNTPATSLILSATAPLPKTAIIITGVILASLIFWYIASGRLKRTPWSGAAILIIIAAFITFVFINPSNLGKIIRGETTLSKVINSNKDIHTVGGTSVTLEAQPSIDPHTGEEITITTEAMDSAKNILEKRLNAKGIIDASIYI